MSRSFGILLACASILAFAGCSRASSQSQPATTLTIGSLPVTARIATTFIGEGELEVRTEKSGRTKLALERLDVAVTTAGDVAETSVEHVFRNDSDETLEGTFRFPLPEGAILTGMAMEIDGKLIDGELVERDKARKVYEQIVDQMQDPALLEWENGSTFKLRVFPIEAKQNKRVVLRFIAPLHRTAEGAFVAFKSPSSQAGLTTERVTMSVDGKKVTASSNTKAETGEILVSVAGAATDVVSESAKDGAKYWLAHVRPGFAASAPAVPATGQALIVLCDRSRSMLEARALQKKTLGILLDKLGAADRFTVITGDVRTKSLGALRSAAPSDKAAALGFVDGIEPDGASDVAKLLQASAAAVSEARASKLDPVIVYLGDATATWGETRAAELERIAKESTSGATMHVVMLGKSADEQTARALSAETHGRLLRPKTEADAERSALEILAARSQRRLDDVHIAGADGLDLPSILPSTLYEGDELSVVLRAGKDDKAPAEVRLLATEAATGKPVSQIIDLGKSKPARHVGQRWAKAKIEQLEQSGDAHKDEVVKTSLDHGVMSRYTSFLVLDSEEAYERFKIARKAKQLADADAQRVSGSVDGDGRGASVSPDHLQPGDPEVRIPAPADAQSVVVVFPFGETKMATFEPDDPPLSSGEPVSPKPHGAGFWVARFLVDRHTPDGTYEILVRITHKDGRIEIVKLPYVVDTIHPSFDVSITRKKSGGFEIRARQKLTAAEIDAQSPNAPAASTLSLDQKRERFAHILTDAKRVEVVAPDGQIFALTHVKLGEFAGTWTPKAGFDAASAAPNKLRLVAVDRALNENTIEVELPR